MPRLQIYRKGSRTLVSSLVHISCSSVKNSQHGNKTIWSSIGLGKTRQDTCTSYKKMNVTKVCWLNYLYTFNFSNDKLFSCQLRLTLYTNKKNYKYLKFRSLYISVTDRMITSKMLVQHETFSKLLTNMLTVKLTIIIIIIIISTTATLETEESGCC